MEEQSFRQLVGFGVSCSLKAHEFERNRLGFKLVRPLELQVDCLLAQTLLRTARCFQQIAKAHLDQLRLVFLRQIDHFE